MINRSTFRGKQLCTNSNYLSDTFLFLHDTSCACMSTNNHTIHSVRLCMNDTPNDISPKCIDMDDEELVNRRRSFYGMPLAEMSEEGMRISK